MPEPSDQLDVAELVRQLKASRETFEKAFDTFVDARPDELTRFKALAFRRQKREPLELGPARDEADMRVALDHAKEHGFLGDLCSAAGATLFTAAPKGGGVVMAVALTADGEARHEAQITFEAIINDSERFRDPDEVNAGLMRAQRCTCRVVVRQGEKRIRGTGFLIGPRLVLTNWHVVQSLLESLPSAEAAAAGLAPAEAWRAKENSAAALRVEFDFTARAAQAGGVTQISASSDWLVAASRSEGSEHANDEQTGAQWPQDVTAFEPFDDFAVVEIAEPVGLDRRFYDIIGEEPPLPRGNMVLLHHPGEYSMRVSYGSFDVKPAFAKLLGGTPPKTSARVLHDANSIGGSSGGPCLDFDMRPVALHQAGVEFGQNADITDDTGKQLRKSVINIAIPLRRVRQKAGTAIQARMGDLRALKPILSNGDPLIGRGELQEAIAEARAGKVKILIVRSDTAGDGKPYRAVGKSFSKRILKEHLDASQHDIVEMSAASLLHDASKSAGAVLDAVKRGLSANLPPINGATLPGDRQSTEINEIVARIAVEVKERLVAAAGGRTLWIVIDDLEKHSLPDPSTRILLDFLYAEVSAAPSLRLVLVGLADVDLPSLQGIRAKRLDKPLTHLDSGRVARWVGHRVDGRFALPDAAYECLAGVVTSVASGRVTEDFSMTQAVAAIVKNDLDPHLKKRMGL
ncbi:trypsin-like peptidase domain-containing protein [Mesorhizobium sp. M1D.F.Ca.ET.043.01.1.1]|uniref:trypsin-like serine peptidase n=1 Tax=Mesorhizobium sp. M1D.F.Ca.ET.043.01.1.1 TaxID=2493669 RepID=UPI000F750475|nr:trypsin-like peptidase domain-containing protein [Mesorhizobium sp. M1D.F.Ca.ET.043.01.1.1]AZO73499.1 ATP-binding protein [Mesorhizobium sp. M1D.F.Ca.ET.043.01.1.1]